MEDIEQLIRNEIGEVDLLTLSRERLIDLVIRKHEIFFENYTSKIKEINAVLPELKQKLPSIKKQRDEMNEKVQDIKKSRDSLAENIKKMKGEYFGYIDERFKDKKDHFSDDDRKNLAMYRKQLKDVDWKLETEGTDIKAIKRLEKEVELCYSKIKLIAQKIDESEEREQKIKELEKKLSSTRGEKQVFHEKMLALVKDANIVHDEWSVAYKDVKNKESELSWMKRWIENHKSAIEYWVHERAKNVHKDDKKDVKTDDKKDVKTDDKKEVKTDDKKDVKTDKKDVKTDDKKDVMGPPGDEDIQKSTGNILSVSPEQNVVEPSKSEHSSIEHNKPDMQVSETELKE